MLMRRLTPSITLCTSSTSEKPRRSEFEMSKVLPTAAVSTPPKRERKFTFTVMNKKKIHQSFHVVLWRSINTCSSFLKPQLIQNFAKPCVLQEKKKSNFLNITRLTQYIRCWNCPLYFYSLKILVGTIFGGKRSYSYSGIRSIKNTLDGGKKEINSERRNTLTCVDNH